MHVKEKYGEENVLFVRRDKIYLIFKFYLPLTLVLLITSLTLWGILSIEGGGFATLTRGTLWLLLVLSIAYFGRVSIGKLIDYYMDYMIVTPKDISLYDQGGILHRSSNSLDVSKIKTVSVRQYGLLGSIFNYGSIIFFAEGDVHDDQVGHIRLNYVANPRKIRGKIATIIVLGKAQSRLSSASLQSHTDKFQVSKT